MHIQGQTDSGTARQLLPEGTCGKSLLLTLWISFAPQKSSKSYEMSYCTFTLLASTHLGMLEWLVNCFLKAFVGILDWHRVQEW